MDDNGVRRSVIVKFNAGGGGWSIRESADENSPPPHIVRRSSVWAVAPPPPLMLVASPKGMRRELVKNAPRTPLAPTNVFNIETQVLVSEMRLLEQQLQNACKQIKVQNRIIDGFCRLKLG